MNVIKVVSAEYVKGYTLKLSFSDGKNGIVDLEKELYGVVFEPLKDLNVFKSFKVDTWTVCWPNGADFSPEFLYSQAMKSELQLENK